jgi:membrane-associated phospholipid phosphatase
MSVRARAEVEPDLMAERSRFLGWPGLAHLGYCVGLMIVNGLWFLLVFGGCDFVTERRALRVQVALPGELEIPFVASMTVAYVSLYPLLLAGPFVLRERARFRAAVAALAAAIGIAGVCFLLVPAQLAFPPVPASELGIWEPLFRMADRLNLTYNLLPSLHVALTVVCVAAFATRAGRIGGAVLWAWAGVIALSTLLTHQHHMLDVLTGWGLALICFKYVYRPLAEPRSAS